MTHSTEAFRAGRAPFVGVSRAGLGGSNQVALISAGGLPAGGKGMQMSPVFCYRIVPAAISANNLATAQQPAAAGNLVLTAGAGITLGTLSGQPLYYMDVPRALSFTTLGNESGVTITVNGYDSAMQAITQSQALPATATTAFTKKAFLAVSSISVSGATAANITVGVGDIFGLPYAVTDRTACLGARWNNTLALDTGTLTVADATSPATATTGDCKGTYQPSAGASDGVKQLVIGILGANPDTEVGLYGVTPA